MPTAVSYFDRSLESIDIMNINENTTYHGWPSTQAEVKTEAEAHQAGTTLRPEWSHSYIYIHALVI